MQYTNEILAEHLGKKFNADAEYIIETHRGAATRVLAGKFKIVGEVPDFSLNEKGTMVVLECVKADALVDRTIAAPVRGIVGQKAAATSVDQTPPPPEPVVHAETATMTPVGEAKPLPTEEKVEPPKAETKPVPAPKVVHKHTPAKRVSTATDRGGKPLGGKKK
jgi:outer membrane biosynthesis protein TonB